jgi:hypothetical protein
MVLLKKGDSDIYELVRFFDNERNSDLVELGRNSNIKGIRDFFTHTFMNDSLTVTKDALSIKLQKLISVPKFAESISGPNTIDFGKEINTKGKIIIIRLSENNMKKTLPLYCRLLIATIHGIISSRSAIAKELRIPTQLYIDELNYMASPTISNMLETSGKYGLSLILSHQLLSQINPKIMKSILANSMIKIFGQNSHENHRIMSKELNIDINMLKNLKKYHFYSKDDNNDVIEITTTDKFIDNKGAIKKSKYKKNIKYQLKKYYRDITLYDNDTKADNNNETGDSLTRLNSDLDFEIEEF